MAVLIIFIKKGCSNSLQPFIHFHLLSAVKYSSEFYSYNTLKRLRVDRVNLFLNFHELQRFAGAPFHTGRVRRFAAQVAF